MFGLRAQFPRWRGWCGLAALLLPAGCTSPFAGRVEPNIDQIIAQAVAAETDPSPSASMPAEPADASTATAPSQSEVIQALSSRLPELESLSPPLTPEPATLDLGLDLNGQPQQHVVIGLQQAVHGALSRNLQTQIARLQPGIAEQDVIAAQAVFDWLLFTNANVEWIDEPQTVPVLFGQPLTTPFNVNQSYRFETGVRKQFATGGEATISTELRRFNNDSPGLELFPDPAYTPAVRLGVTQPLLRGFGSDVTQAEIRIAQNTTLRAVADLESNLLSTALDTEVAYWTLVQAWRELAIRQWLVEQSVEARRILDRRRAYDTRPAEYSDAVAKVEQRRANLIRARHAVRRTSDDLKALINDPQLSAGSEAVIWPQDDVVSAPISFSLREAMVSAIDSRPEVQRAILDIDDATIRQRVAGNARLPALDVTAQIAYFGLDRNVGDAYSELNDARFIDYLLGVAFEYPLGNRAADAGYQQARLRRSAAILKHQRAVQDVALEVKAALRQVRTSHELIEATRTFRIAQAENLRTLQVEAVNNAAFTPEFLNLLFTRQETLAQARFEEIAALITFDKAIAALHRAMGISLKQHGVSVEQER